MNVYRLLIFDGHCMEKYIASTDPISAIYNSYLAPSKIIKLELVGATDDEDNEKIIGDFKKKVK
jgi:hypothetical protein